MRGTSILLKKITYLKRIDNIDEYLKLFLEVSESKFTQIKKKDRIIILDGVELKYSTIINIITSMNISAIYRNDTMYFWKKEKTNMKDLIDCFSRHFLDIIIKDFSKNKILHHLNEICGDVSVNAYIVAKYISKKITTIEIELTDIIK